MRPLSAAQLLDAWERGLSESRCSRTLPVLAAASPDSSAADLAALSIGERDRWLLRLREWSFGSQWESVARCTACGEGLEWAVNTADLFVEKEAEPATELSLEIDRYSVSFRLPKILDVAAISELPESNAARQMLLERCVSSARRDGEEISCVELPVAVVNAITTRMSEADPQAEINVDLACPACGHQWQALFDIESFFWIEINAWAQRLLTEVHALAKAYGWREADILNLSPWRRKVYLDLVSA